jgi:hypothetical protein
MSTNISDKLLINLKILSKIQKNGRITRSYDGIISLDTLTFYQPLRRFLSSDSRKQAVFEINSIVMECIESMHSIINSRYMSKNFANTDEFRKNCEHLSLLLNEMEYAKCGIDNLKFTYQNDPNIASQLDITILKFSTAIKDGSKKLGELHILLPQQQTKSFEINGPTNYSQSQFGTSPTNIKPIYPDSYIPDDDSRYETQSTFDQDALNMDHISQYDNNNNQYSREGRDNQYDDNSQFGEDNV